MAFLAIRPINEGHAIVIPKKHYESIYDLPDDEIIPLFKIVKKVAFAVKESVNAKGITIMERQLDSIYSMFIFTLSPDMRSRNCI